MNKERLLKSLGILVLIGLLVALCSLPVLSAPILPEPPGPEGNNAPTIGTVTVTGAVPKTAGYLSVTLSATITNLGGTATQSCYFQYGPSTSYGLVTLKKSVTSSTVLPYTINKNIKVMPGAIYHYRLVCKEGTATYTYSDDHVYNSQPIREVSTSDITADHGYSGDTESGTIGEALAFGEICYLKNDNKWWGTDADSELTTAGILAICVVGGAPSATGTFLTKGYVRDDSWAWSANGAALWVGNSPRTMVETGSQPAGSGDQIRLVGYTRSATVIRFNPDETYLELP
jgi:hypothetical protein